MTLRLLRRADVVVRQRVTLADVADRWVGLHGDRLMVTEEGVTAGASSGRNGLRRGTTRGSGSGPGPGPGPVRQLTYGQAAELVARWSAAVAARTSPGDPVVLATPNGIDQFLLALAVSRAGRIPAPVNPQMRPAEIDHVIADSGATTRRGRPALPRVPSSPTGRWSAD